MTEEKKATVDVQIFMEAEIAYKMLNVSDTVKITFNMTDVPVDAKDEMIKVSASSNIADDIDKGTGTIKAVNTKDNCICFIAISDIRKFTVKNIELKRGE